MMGNRSLPFLKKILSNGNAELRARVLYILLHTTKEGRISIPDNLIPQIIANLDNYADISDLEKEAGNRGCYYAFDILLYSGKSVLPYLKKAESAGYNRVIRGWVRELIKCIKQGKY